MGGLCHTLCTVSMATWLRQSPIPLNRFRNMVVKSVTSSGLTEAVFGFAGINGNLIAVALSGRAWITVCWIETKNCWINQVNPLVQVECHLQLHSGVAAALITTELASFFPVVSCCSWSELKWPVEWSLILRAVCFIFFFSQLTPGP